MGILNSMKAECPPLGVPMQDQFTIQSLHSAHSFQSDLEGDVMEIEDAKQLL